MSPNRFMVKIIMDLWIIIIIMNQLMQKEENDAMQIQCLLDKFIDCAKRPHGSNRLIISLIW